MKNKPYLILIFIFLIIMMVNISVFAHKVNIFAYVEGDKIYTESYFNDGKMCVDSKIEVFDNQGNKLLEGLTDEEGMFSFEIPSKDVIDGDLKEIQSLIEDALDKKLKPIMREMIEIKKSQEDKISPTEIIGGIGYIIGIFGIIAYFLSRKR